MDSLDNPPFDAGSSDFAWLVGQFGEIINVLVFVLFTLVFTFLMWQIIRGFIINGGDQTKVEEAKKTVFFGFIVLIVMTSIWGIVALLRSSIVG